MAATGARAADVMTEWRAIVEVNWPFVSRGMASPRFIFDGRNALDPVTMRMAGFEYVGVGRASSPKESPGC